MLLNATTAISTSTILLVPYSKRHVLKYHEWMKDEEIQQATASEPLTLEEEYSMQQRWRQDADKLTFIACLPLSVSSSSFSGSSSEGPLLSLSDEDDAPDRMIGDTNLFLRLDDDDDDDGGGGDDENEDKKVIGEIELMIAEKQNQGQGLGRAALLTFLWYVVSHEGDIMDEFLAADGTTQKGKRLLKCLSVKIGKDNTRSLALFESLGFVKRSQEPNYFAEFELRRYGLDVDAVGRLADKYGLKGYTEVYYGGE